MQQSSATPQFFSDYVSSLTLSGQRFETFYGHVNSAQDCKLLVEQCIAGKLPLLSNNNCVDSKQLRIRSGTVIVFEEGAIKIFRDGGKWSLSRSRGRFLMYREIEQITSKNFQQIRQSYKEPAEFQTSGLRPNTRLVVNGLVKRTATVMGSNGKSFRIVAYFYPKDVDPLNPRAHLDTPSKLALRKTTPLVVCRSPTPEFVLKSHNSSPTIVPLSPAPESERSTPHLQ
ncbi:Gti1/Pac2 family-domain-containing protein [Obelidium mucronatum]|nr:Gti1/Pac2 family-domain-containing protein [Obelidium mucronatum]